MVSYRNIIVISTFLLASCAQVGSLTGGIEDMAAPRPIVSKMLPKNETVQFSSKSIVIPFDEFIQLNDARKNIIMVPAHATINAEVKGKTLYLNWEEELAINTTYAIYLNNAVRDITERNDSLIQYVFSTGLFIDSLEYSVQVIDAWTNQPVESCLVGMFDVETHELVNFNVTDKGGVARLKYLPSKTYSLFAFIDENRDLEIQEHEQVGFQEDTIIHLLSSRLDSIPIRLFSPEASPELRTVKSLGNGRFILGSNSAINTSAIWIDGKQLHPERIKEITTDSLMVFSTIKELSSIELVLQTDEFSDTTKLRFSVQREAAEIVVKSSKANNRFKPRDSLTLNVDDFIIDIDQSLIKVMRIEDSSLIENVSFTFEYDEVFLQLNRDSLSQLRVEFEAGAIKTSHGSNYNQSLNLTLMKRHKFGSISIQLEGFEDPVIIQMISNGKVMEEVALENPSSGYQMLEALPGEYSFKIINDTNGNSKWDVGKKKDLLQAEEIYYYSKPTKVRANWSIDVVLIKE